ncbi:unnamed protein product [Brassica napus]|uniref:dihydropyrimidine dehydrogenase (NADP(+)) n=1 Tax=Brassica napus TaxID=3708 RepID=A0A816I6Q7_BRANA|nr:unnamed protein product [Brassica napus]
MASMSFALNRFGAKTTLSPDFEHSSSRSFRPSTRVGLKITSSSTATESEPDLSVTVNGLKMSNPFVIGSGPPGTNYTVMKRAFDEGWGGVIAKTDALEINFSCPHGMPERRMDAAVGQDCALLEEVCGWVNAKATVPMWAKMTPNITDITEPARVSLKSGCEGISAINTIMSVMGIDLKMLHPEPCVEGNSCTVLWCYFYYSTPGGYSYKAVRPIALAKVMNIAQMMKDEFNENDCSLSGIGGVETEYDAAVFILLGSNTVQVCTGVMVHGYGHVKILCAELQDFMKQHNFSTIEDFRGHSLEYFTTHTDLVKRQKEAIEQRKAERRGLKSDKDWTEDGFVKETESMVSN